MYFILTYIWIENIISWFKLWKYKKELSAWSPSITHLVPAPRGRQSYLFLVSPAGAGDGEGCFLLIHRFTRRGISLTLLAFDPIFSSLFRMERVTWLISWEKNWYVELHPFPSPLWVARWLQQRLFAPQFHVGNVQGDLWGPHLGGWDCLLLGFGIREKFIEKKFKLKEKLQK